MMPRLVLLPGLDGTGGLFGPFLRAWNHGPTPLVMDYPRDHFLDYEQCFAHVRERLPPDEKFVVVAESFSGPVGILLAARMPERVIALVLCATFVSPPRKGALCGIIKFFAPLAFRIPVPHFAIHQLLLNGHRDAKLLSLVCSNKSRVRSAVMERRLQAVMSADARDELKKVRCPVLYLQAARDRLVPPSAAAEILAARPAAKIIRIGSPHFVLQTQPTESANAIAEFLRDMPAVSAD